MNRSVERQMIMATTLETCLLARGSPFAASLRPISKNVIATSIHRIIVFSERNVFAISGAPACFCPVWFHRLSTLNDARRNRVNQAFLLGLGESSMKLPAVYKQKVLLWSGTLTSRHTTRLSIPKQANTNNDALLPQSYWQT